MSNPKGFYISPYNRQQHMKKTTTFYKEKKERNVPMILNFISLLCRMVEQCSQLKEKEALEVLKSIQKHKKPQAHSFYGGFRDSVLQKINVSSTTQTSSQQEIVICFSPTLIISLTHTDSHTHTHPLYNNQLYARAELVKCFQQDKLVIISQRLQLSQLFCVKGRLCE